MHADLLSYRPHVGTSFALYYFCDRQLVLFAEIVAWILLVLVSSVQAYCIYQEVDAACESIVALFTVRPLYLAYSRTLCKQCRCARE